MVASPRDVHSQTAVKKVDSIAIGSRICRLWAVYTFCLVKMVGKVGVEPTVYLTSRSYCPLHSPLCLLTHIVLSVDLMHLRTAMKERSYITKVIYVIGGTTVPWGD